MSGRTKKFRLYHAMWNVTNLLRNWSCACLDDGTLFQIGFCFYNFFATKSRCVTSFLASFLSHLWDKMNITESSLSNFIRENKSKDWTKPTFNLVSETKNKDLFSHSPTHKQVKKLNNVKSLARKILISAKLQGSLPRTISLQKRSKVQCEKFVCASCFMFKCATLCRFEKHQEASSVCWANVRKENIQMSNVQILHVQRRNVQMCNGV